MEGIALITVAADGETEILDVAVGRYHGCALYAQGSVWCWGDEIVTGHASAPLRAHRVTGLPEMTTISAGRAASCGTDRTGALWCWGVNLQTSVRKREQVGSVVPFRVEKLPAADASAIGYIHQCALSRTGDVYCWAGNPRGELGSGDTTAYADPVKVAGISSARAISAGINNSCAALENGQVMCWGSDNPTRARSSFIYGTTTPIAIRTVSHVIAVANGRNFACGLRMDGKVTCWGSNIYGQLGTRTLREIAGPAGIGEVDDITAADDLDVGDFHACAVERGNVLCWGAMYEDPAELSPEELSFYFATLHEKRRIEGIRSAKRVGVGEVFSCAVDGNAVVCWGVPEDPSRGLPALLEGMGPYKAVRLPGLPG